ncbi:MAG TPA: acyl-CoA thioesterase [Stellaceae bacterium]|nr:acyl-CoA thioesterase [Stellaceae bacterium]
MLINRHTLRVEWGDCDAAGIVFYPRYFAWFDACTFHLFARTGLSMRALWEKYGSVGTPLVDASARFIIPSRWGEDLVCESGVSGWGESSFSVQHRILKDGKLAVEGTEKRVWVVPHPTEKGRIKSAPIPAEIVTALSDATGATQIAS